MEGGFVEFIALWGMRVASAIFLLLVGWVLAKMLRSWLTRILQYRQLDPLLVPFITKLVYYLSLAFVVTAVLGIFGIQTTSFIAVLGAAGLAIGLALQGTLSNFASGVMLLVFRPFKLGDYIEAGGTAGSVQEMGVFATTLNTPDNVRIVVPNSTVYGQIIKNYSANDNRRNDMVVGVAYGDDLEQAIAVIKEMLAADGRVLEEPAPVVAIGELDASSVNILVRPWNRKEDYWDFRFDFLRAVPGKLNQAGCSIPFPQTDVHLHQVPAEKKAN